MTTRVFDCRSRLELASPRPESRPGPARPRGAAIGLAALSALVLVPLAGAAEPPFGWIAGAGTALTVLIVAATAGGRIRWGWLALLGSVVALGVPRGHLALIGPVLFVASSLCVVLWLANRRSDHDARDGRPRRGTHERKAQEMQGIAGECHVGRVLASQLPHDFVLINGLKLARGPGDIDHVVVGPTGVFLIETKTMAGRIVCDPDGTWRRTRVDRAGTRYPAFIGDPAAQVQRSIYAARECLRRRLPTRRSMWIEGLVVFAHPRTELAAEHSPVAAVRLEHAAAHIRSFAPRRSLEPADVDDVVDALLVEGGERDEHAGQARPAAQSAQAIVELALAMPLVLALLFGTLALNRIIQAHTAVLGVAHEAARAGALATTADDAVGRMRHRAAVVATGLGLDPRRVVLDWDVSRFGGDRGRVVATVRYRVELGDLPLVGWAPGADVRAEHVEWVDPFRSGIARSEAWVP